MATNKDIIELQKIGFLANDAVVYLKLIEIGTSSAGPIITGTALHRNVVYTSLEHLVGRKLVEVKEIRGVKTFSAVEPSVLLTEFDEKKRIADNIVQTLGQRIGSNKQEITIHEGNDEYLLLLTNLIGAMPKYSTKYVLGTGGQEFMDATMIPIWKKYHKVAHSRGISIKMIGYDLQRKIIQSYTDSERIYDIRYLPSDQENPAGVHIYPELGVVLNIIYSTKNTPVTAIKIKNKAFVESYLSMFKNLWEKAIA